MNNTKKITSAIFLYNISFVYIGRFGIGLNNCFFFIDNELYYIKVERNHPPNLSFWIG